MVLGQLLTIDEARGSQEDALLVQGRVQVLEDAGEGVLAWAGALNRRIPGETPQLGAGLFGARHRASRDDDCCLVEVAQLRAHRLRRQVDGEASQQPAGRNIREIIGKKVGAGPLSVLGLPGQDRDLGTRPADVRETLAHRGRFALDADGAPELCAARDGLGWWTRHGEHRHGAPLQEGVQRQARGSDIHQHSWGSG